MDQQRDFGVVHQILGFQGLCVGGHDDDGAELVVGRKEGIVHQRDVRCRRRARRRRDGCQMEEAGIFQTLGYFGREGGGDERMGGGCRGLVVEGRMMGVCHGC